MSMRITVERDGHVLMIGINRPEKRNAFDPESLDARVRNCCAPLAIPNCSVVYKQSVFKKSDPASLTTPTLISLRRN